MSPGDTGNLFANPIMLGCKAALVPDAPPPPPHPAAPRFPRTMLTCTQVHMAAG